MYKKNIVVVGAGKGLGNRIAEKFGKNNFRGILMTYFIKCKEVEEKAGNVPPEVPEVVRTHFIR